LKWEYSDWEKKLTRNCTVFTIKELVLQKRLWMTIRDDGKDVGINGALDAYIFNTYLIVLDPEFS
jgi:hypothetical protein